MPDPITPERPAMTEPELTRRQNQVLHVLRFREPLGGCWLYPSGRGDRYTLLVPTMMADHHLEPLWAISETTIRALIDSGLVTLGAAADIPGTRMVGWRINLADNDAAVAS